MSDPVDVDAKGEAQGGARPRARSRRTAIAVLVLVLVVVAAGVTAYTRLVLAGYESTDDATLSGSQVVVAAQVLGKIVSMGVAEGDRVEQGNRLVTLDESALRAQEEQAKASRELAALNMGLAGVKLEEAQSDFARATVLMQSKVIPQEQYDHLKTALAAAQAQRDIAEAQEKLAAAQLAAAQVNLAQTVITSPIDGVVARKWASVGEIVQPAQSIYTLYGVSDLWVEANFKETQVSKLSVGDAAEIAVDASPHGKLKGRVESIGAATGSQFALIPAGNASGNYTKVTQRVAVKISIDGADNGGARAGGRLLPGMSAEVRVRIARG